MASFTLASVADKWPVNASVSAYRPGGTVERAVSGGPIATGTVQADGSLTFSGLEADTTYVAWSGVGAPVRFRTNPAATVGPGGDTTIIVEDLPTLKIRDLPPTDYAPTVDDNGYVLKWADASSHGCLLQLDDEHPVGWNAGALSAGPGGVVVSAEAGVTMIPAGPWQVWENEMLFFYKDGENIYKQVIGPDDAAKVNLSNIWTQYQEFQAGIQVDVAAGRFGVVLESDVSGTEVLRTRSLSLAAYLFSISAEGLHAWGGGAAAPDLTLRRVGAGVMLIGPLSYNISPLPAVTGAALVMPDVSVAPTTFPSNSAMLYAKGGRWRARSSDGADAAVGVYPNRQQAGKAYTVRPNSVTTPTAGATRTARFVPSEDIFVNWLAVALTVASGAADGFEMFITDAATDAILYRTGQVTNVVNQLAIRHVAVTAPGWIRAGVVYHVGWQYGAAVGGTSPQIQVFASDSAAASEWMTMLAAVPATPTLLEQEATSFNPGGTVATLAAALGPANKTRIIPCVGIG